MAKDSDPVVPPPVAVPPVVIIGKPEMWIAEIGDQRMWHTSYDAAYKNACSRVSGDLVATIYKATPIVRVRSAGVIEETA